MISSGWFACKYSEKERAPFNVPDKGFSRKTFAPASSISVACSSCRDVSVAIRTASQTRAFARSWRDEKTGMFVLV
jgi:hypothetical protein